MLTLFFQQDCYQVIGISNTDEDRKAAEEIAGHEDNNITNAIFMKCEANNLQTCTSFLKKHQSVAILDVKSVFGKSNFNLNLVFTNSI